MEMVMFKTRCTLNASAWQKYRRGGLLRNNREMLKIIMLPPSVNLGGYFRKPDILDEVQDSSKLTFDITKQGHLVVDHPSRLESFYI